jgi:hypothetical protein
MPGENREWSLICVLVSQLILDQSQLSDTSQNFVATTTCTIVRLEYDLAITEAVSYRLSA